jgi:hypothetical protein|mmetsp:Transcript_29148/g.5271  ORF Transcript_29148/g.5271 Transcript_29148/m.5271 type:complete len:87 (+) Transcript_29148:1867-2127(+)
MVSNNFAETLTLSSYHGYTLNSMRVFDGSTLLIEEMEDIMTRGKWQAELDRESRRFNLKFNDPNDTTSSYAKFNYSIVFDSYSTLE